MADYELQTFDLDEIFDAVNKNVKEEVHRLLDELHNLKNGINGVRTITVSTWVTHLINSTAQFEVLLETYDYENKEALEDGR